MPSQPKLHTLNLSGLVLPKHIESKARSTKLDTCDSVVFDFSRAAFIDVASLLTCSAFANEFSSEGKDVALRYPSSRKVTDFLNLWRFSEAIAAATGKDLEKVVVEGQESKLALPIQNFNPVSRELATLEHDQNWEEGSTANRNFFEIITLNLSTKENLSQLSPEDAFKPSRESERWNRLLIKEVLNKHLHSSRDDVARSIIFETISNAVRHPNASLVQVASRFYASQSLSERNRNSNKSDVESEHFMLCVWDNGDSIPSTLRSVLEKGGIIQNPDTASIVHDRIVVTLESTKSNKKRIEVFDPRDQIEDPSTTEARLLLASLCAGVTQSLFNRVPNVRLEPEDRLAEKGMGLYTVLRAVIYQLGGRLIVRSGTCLLEIEAAHDQYRVKYQAVLKAKIKTFPGSKPYKGNHITIHLPLIPGIR